jgi:hypothetical protein
MGVREVLGEGMLERSGERREIMKEVGYGKHKTN